MLHPSSATIFLAEQYPIFQTAERRSINVLRDQKKFKQLSSIKDETLAAGKCTEYQLTNSLVLVPVVGTVIAEINATETEIACGELLIINADTLLKVYNPYNDHLVNYLLIYITANAFPEATNDKMAFDLDDYKNEILPVLDKDDIKISLGKLEMRREATYYSDRNQRTSFCFVIQGSFEIEGRLLHARDALAVWGTDLLEIESLGKESILLLIEFPR